MCTHLDVFWNKKTQDTANGLSLESSHVAGSGGGGVEGGAGVGGGGRGVSEVTLPRSKT